MSRKIRTEAVDSLFDAVLSLKSREECYTFFEDVCTINELLSLSQRFEVAKMEKSRIGELQDSIRKAYETAEHSFVCVDDEEREQLQKFAFICNLSFDVYVKKQLIEKMVDELPKPDKKK